MFGGFLFGFLALSVAARPLAGEQDSALPFPALELRGGDVARVHGRQSELDAFGPCELEALADCASSRSPRIVLDVGNEFVRIEVEPVFAPAALSKSQHFRAAVPAAIVGTEALALVPRVTARDLGMPGGGVVRAAVEAHFALSTLRAHLMSSSRSESSVVRNVASSTALMCCSIVSRNNSRSTCGGSASSSTLSPSKLLAWRLPFRLVGRVGSLNSAICSSVRATRSR